MDTRRYRLDRSSSGVHPPVTEPGATSPSLYILPSGTPVCTLEFLSESAREHTGELLFALALAEESQPLPPGEFFLRTLARAALTRFAYAAAEHPHDLPFVLEHIQLPPPQLQKLLDQCPPLPGSRYVTPHVLTRWLGELQQYIGAQLQQRNALPGDWLCTLPPPWGQIGKVFFHLAENRDDTSGTRPFAFLATFSHRSNTDNRLRHLPLESALKLYGQDSPVLNAIMQPLAAVPSDLPFFGTLLQQGKIYAPQALTASQAKHFLAEIPAYEQAGIIVRIVNLWKTPPAALQVNVSVGDPAKGQAVHAAGISVHSLLRFSMRLTLGGRELSPQEVEELLKYGDGLIRFKGDWVQVDAAKLRDLTSRWQKALHLLNRFGVPLVQGLRLLLTGKAQLPAPVPESDPLCTFSAGDIVQQALDRLQGKTAMPVPPVPDSLTATLRPYQHRGYEFLHRLTQCGFGACLADDMGLGKTLQTLAWLDSLRALGNLDKRPALVIAPASLLTNWQQECARFVPQLKTTVWHPSMPGACSLEQALQLGFCHVVITTYGMVTRTPQLAAPVWQAIVLDEAQAVKNAASARTQAVMALQAERRVALSGTPIENNLHELRSLMEFLNPGLLGTKQQFNSLIQSLGNNYAPLRQLINPFILRRMKTDKALLPDLPDKTEIPAYCTLSPEQAALYQSQIDTLHAVLDEPDPAARLKLLLPLLARLKQICNHPAQFCGTDDFVPERSGKFLRLQQLCALIAARHEKAIFFTQFRSIIPHLHDLIAPVFGTAGLTLHGGTPIAQRQAIVAAFQQDKGPPYCILSLKAAGTGLTLTQASHVVHVDRWWNPAVENQATDRAYRIGQHNNVLVHRLICKGTIEERIDTMLKSKHRLAQDLFAGNTGQWLMDLNPEQLTQLFRLG